MRSASSPCCILPMSGAASVSDRHSGARWRSQPGSARRRASASSLCSIRCRRRGRGRTNGGASIGTVSVTPCAEQIGEAPRVLEVSHSGDIAVLKMGHGKVNALDIELCGHITSRLEELGTSSAPAVVLTGQAGIFSAGVDLIRALEGGGAYLRDFLPVLRKLFDVMFFYPKPVVAAINGHAIAGGCVLACAADQRLMARGSGRIGVTELLVGLPYPVIALEIMRFTAVPAYFREVIFGGGRYPAEAAATRGLVDVIVDPEALLADAVEAARSLASLAPAAFALTKSQTRQPVLDQLQKYGDVFDAAADEIWLAPESASRIRDYVSRTFKKI